MTAHVFHDSIFIIVDDEGRIIGAETESGEQIPHLERAVVDAGVDAVQRATLTLAVRVKHGAPPRQ